MRRQVPRQERTLPPSEPAAGGRETDPENSRMAGAALEFRCRHVTQSLREALGPDGCSALLARALAECEPDHPALRQMRGADERELQLHGIPAVVATHGIVAVEAAVEALITSLLGILARLIGDDMALRLIDLDIPAPGDDREVS